MNIFFTDECPKIAARNLCLVHINKMLIESCQMLSSVHHRYNTKHAPYVNKEAYPNHPCTLWVGESRKHYVWLYRHAMEMGRLWFKARGKPHGCSTVLRRLKNVPYPLKNTNFVRPPVAGPDIYKNMDDVTEAYKLILIEKYKDWLTRKIYPMPVDFVEEIPQYWLEATHNEKRLVVGTGILKPNGT